jgi:hypothetical protein
LAGGVGRSRTPVRRSRPQELAERIAAAAATLPRVSGFLCRICAGDAKAGTDIVQSGHGGDAASTADLAVQIAMSISAEDDARNETFRLVAPALPRTLAGRPGGRRDDQGRTSDLSPLSDGDRSLASLQRCSIFHTAWISCIHHSKLPLPRSHNRTVPAIVGFWKGHHRGSDTDPDPGKRF